MWVNWHGTHSLLRGWSGHVECCASGALLDRRSPPGIMHRHFLRLARFLRNQLFLTRLGLVLIVELSARALAAASRKGLVFYD